ncbi:MAG: LLM class flavin-dependent oxidoreductase [Alphaproteobacteria bacterium]|jgi:alkanesulfonate monooxygenase SsuD/methylene tetrahydromethanopterin reductase-like flavin-dependent oxidoreductase (luciferase family)|nr:LLM class flavin-dependent oxidoreductase [Alphaproteobacteria bacterium]
MDFGIFNVMQQRERTTTSKEVTGDALYLTRAAEEMGLTRAWYAEHHFSNYSLCPSPLMLIAHAAAITETIRLGTAVVVPPLYMPTRLLGEIAMADELSDGRLDLGVGFGYQRYEFERFGVELDEKMDRTHELLDMIELGLGQPHFSYDGKYYKQQKTAINIRPVQQPHPPIWLATTDPKSIERTAEKGYAAFCSSRFANTKELAPMREHVDESFRAAGRDPDAMTLGVLSYCFVGETKAEVENYCDNARYQQRLARSLRARRETILDDYWVEEKPFENEPSLDEIQDNIMAGDVETVTRRAVTLLREIRPTHLTCYFQVGGIDRDTARRSMERFLEDVVPGIEREFGCPIAEINVPQAAESAAAD